MYWTLNLLKAGRKLDGRKKLHWFAQLLKIRRCHDFVRTSLIPVGSLHKSLMSSVAFWIDVEKKLKIPICVPTLPFLSYSKHLYTYTWPEWICLYCHRLLLESCSMAHPIIFFFITFQVLVCMPHQSGSAWTATTARQPPSGPWAYFSTTWSVATYLSSRTSRFARQKSAFGTGCPLSAGISYTAACR